MVSEPVCRLGCVVSMMWWRGEFRWDVQRVVGLSPERRLVRQDDSHARAREGGTVCCASECALDTLQGLVICLSGKPRKQGCAYRMFSAAQQHRPRKCLYRAVTRQASKYKEPPGCTTTFSCPDDTRCQEPVPYSTVSLARDGPVGSMVSQRLAWRACT